MQNTLPTPRFVLGVLVVLVGLLVAIAAPVFVGSKPVYLDENLAPNTTLNDVWDAQRAFTRTSMAHQQAAPGAIVDVQAVTYRPVTMATLALTQGLTNRFAAHHVVSYALHVLTALLVALAVRRSGRPDWLAFAAAALVMAHPAMVEAWVWVSGRADLLGGLCLALLALTVPAKLGEKPWVRLVLGSAIVFVGALSKEAFMVIAPAVFLRGAFEKGVSGRVRLGMLVAVALPIAAAWSIRTSIVRDTTAIPIDLADVRAWLMRAPRLVSEASATLVLPWHRPMRTLALELLTSIGVTAGIGAAALGLSVASATVDRRWGLLLVLLASAVSVIPAAHVADTFWLGFDRFLYMPLVAIVIVFAESWESAPAPSVQVHTVALLLAGLLAAVSNLQATDYQSTKTLTAAISTARPNDPSGSILRASRQIQETYFEEGAHTLEIAPSTNVPAFEGRRATLYVQARRANIAVTIIDALIEDRPRDAYAAKDAIAIALMRSRWADLPGYARVAVQRRGARALSCIGLGGYSSRMKNAPVGDRRYYERARRILRCDQSMNH